MFVFGVGECSWAPKEAEACAKDDLCVEGGVGSTGVADVVIFDVEYLWWDDRKRRWK
jgi:hypothetical protein